MAVGHRLDDLVRRAWSRDPEAWRVLFEFLTPRMCRWANAILKDSHEAADVASRVWLYLLARPVPYAIESRVFHLTRLFCMKVFRSRKRHPGGPLELDPDDQDALGPDEQVAMLDLIQHCWGQLKENDRQLLVSLSRASLAGEPTIPEAASRQVRIPRERTARVAVQLGLEFRTVQAERTRILVQLHDCIHSGICA